MSQEPPQDVVPGLVAHRGYALRYPENTRVGLLAAVNAGARWIETDVQLSADGVPLLFHDRRLLRVCGVDGAIHEATAAQLSRVRAAEPDFFGDRFADTPLATLIEWVELLRDHPGVQCFIEIKTVTIEQFGVQRAVSVVAETIAPVAERCVVISFDPRVPPESERCGLPRRGWIAERWDQVLAPPREVAGIGHLFCNALKVPHSGSLAAAGVELGLYDVIDRDVASSLFERGARLVETFDIGAMLGGFRRRDADAADD